MNKDLYLLLVDDDEDDKAIFAEAMAEIDHSIKCSLAANGYEALQILKDQKRLPDLIFLDLNMPRMNGKQCLTRLKQSDELKNIPVIIFTTSTSPEDMEETKNLGAAHFLIKPSNMKELRKALEIIFSAGWVTNKSVVL
ncbi:MAG: response regulator receiver protein [Segetibacter sp.]|nr:response regulator receiver protein [Segetibacter sp.]